MGWYDDMQYLIRQVFFKDEELKRLMLIPEADKDDLMTFIQKYMIQSVSPSEIVTSEDVRVIFYEEKGTDIEHPYVKLKLFSVDVYVKKDKLYGADENDYTKRRDRLIAYRIQKLMASRNQIRGFKFLAEDDYELASKSENYDRYHIVFSYKKTY